MSASGTPDVSYDARTGQARGTFPTTGSAEVRAILEAAAAAAPIVATTAPGVRAEWLLALADALEEPETKARLVAVADAETALGEIRLGGEVSRTAQQLRFYASVAVEGSYLQVTLDSADASTTPPAPALARVQVPLGVVAVLGASNFPFAFGILGNDTASALAAGCPVVAKAHPAHPETCRVLAEVAEAALLSAGAPLGLWELVSGFDSGTALVQAPEVAAVAFTGSQRGGMALWRQASEREVVIPVFAEMGTVNPAVVTQLAAALCPEEIAAGFVASFTLGMGQFCTKPGLLLVPSGSPLPGLVAEALVAAAPRGWLLTEGIAGSYAAGVEELVAAGAEPLAAVAPEDSATSAPGGWNAGARVFTVAASALTAPSRLTEECFGPVGLVTEYADPAELEAILATLQGTLAASVMSYGEDDPEVAGLLARLTPLAGRVAVNDWPTGVAFRWGQQHGGPWPATTVPSATSVGAAALDRFTRPVTYQSAPDAALPPALQAANPWRLPRRLDGVWTPA